MTAPASIRPLRRCLLLGVLFTLCGPLATPARAGGAAAAAKVESVHKVHQQQLRSMSGRISDLDAKLRAAERSKRTARANLKSHQQGLKWYQKLVDDRRTDFLEGRISSADRDISRLRTQLGDAQSAYKAKQKEFTQVEQTLNTRAIKADPQRLATEKARRVAKTRQVATDYYTQRARLGVVETSFATQLRTQDRMIDKARKNGLPEVAKQLAKDKAKIIDARNAFRERHLAILARRKKDLDRVYKENLRDGIGPTNIASLNRDLNIDSQYETGKLLDSQSLSASKKTASTAAAGAYRNTTHTSIFNEVNSESLKDFALDYASEARKTYGDWETFKGRYGAYAEGVGEAGVDAFKDLYTLGKESVVTLGQATEQAANYYTGRETSTLGRGNLDTLEKAGRAVSGAGTQDVADLAGKIGKAASRGFEKMAGSGEKGLRKALKGVGYATGTVVGVEEAPLKLLAKAGKGVRAVRLWRAGDKVEDATKIARAAEKGADAGKAVRTAEKGADAGKAGRAAELNARIDELYPKADRYGTGKAIPQLDVTIAQKGDTMVITRADGKQIRLNNKKASEGGDLLGEGASSKAYEVPTPDGPPVVVKVTDMGQEGMEAASRLDNFGYDVINKVDPNGDILDIPVKYSTHQVKGSKKIVTIVEKAPEDFAKALKRGESMSDGQRRAYQKAMDALNDKGYAWLDNKPDNYAFKKTGDGDEWKLVIVDPGGIVPMKGLDPKAAKRLQRALDTPIEAIEGIPWMMGGVDLGRAEQMTSLADRFDDLVDWKKVQEVTKKPFSTLGKNYNEKVGDPDILAHLIPYNPKNGIDNPGLWDKLPEAPSKKPRLAKAGEVPGGKPETRRPRTGGDKGPENPLRGYRDPRRLTGEATGADGEGGSGSGITVGGGGAFMPAIAPIRFSFGPVAGSGSCEPRCEYRVEVEQAYLLSGTGFWDFHELEQIDSDTTATRGGGGSGGGGGSSGATISVIPYGGFYFPVDQLSTYGPDACLADHYHSSTGLAAACNGSIHFDPDPGGCGFGLVSATTTLPLASCPWP